jgi:hypothetical protein
MGVLITVTVVHIHTSLPNADREGWKGMLLRPVGLVSPG